jgi:NADH-quinone oxidoreductase subunit G
MPTFKLDGKDIPFQPGETIITAAYKQGIEIPHYCWHPGLSVAANCRMCLVEILPPPGQKPLLLDILEWDPKLGDYKLARKPKLQPACQFQATEGMQVLAETSAHVLQARKAVQEFLLLNHPVDCPICDQSGECKLQDYWLEHGRFQKRMREEPVHKPKAVSFGPTIVYDGERCVMCTRCIRFMAEVAKDPVLDMRERGNLNEVFVAPGRQLEGHYTFMTEHVCPVGALTTKDFRFKARVWFLRSAKSICQGCATGCNAFLDFDPRSNQAHRYRPRENMEVNKFWMCDEGMLTYRNAHEGRVTDARAKGKVCSLAKASELVAKAFADVPRESIAIVLSAQHSLEDNWAMAELGRLLGTTHVFYTHAPNGYRDDILIHEDKNSNTQGIRLLSPDAKPLAELAKAIDAGGIQYAIALGGETAGGEEALEKLSALVTIAAHESALTRAARVVLPATSWAEHSGTYVNANGKKQLADKALEPQGESLPAWQHTAAVARALGLEPTWSSLREVRSKMGGEHKKPELFATTDTQAV